MIKKLASGEFYGTTEKHYDVRGLTLAETAYPRGLTIPPHEHANAFFCLVLEGTVTQTCVQRTSTAEAWDLLVFPAGETHANRWHDSGGRVLHIVAQRWLRQLPERPTILDGPANYRRGPLVWLARRLLMEHRRRDAFSP